VSDEPTTHPPTGLSAIQAAASGDPKPPAGLDAIRAAAGGDPSPAAAFNALAYFMGEEEPPGVDDLITLDMDFDRADGRKVRVVCRSLVVEELDKCAELARNALEKAPAMQDLGLGYFRWSYVFAYACTSPDLGEAFRARRAMLQPLAEGGDAEAAATLKGLTDSAALVRLVFRKRPGILQHVCFQIEAKAKLGDTGADSVSVVEVEAGKALS
jgi:hypothetical protein